MSRPDPRCRYVTDWYAVSFSLAALSANEWIRESTAGAERRALPRLRFTGAPGDAGPAAAAAPAASSRELTARDQAYALALACVEMLDRLEASRWLHPLVALRRAWMAGRARRRELRAYLADAMLPASLVLLAGVAEEPPEEQVVAEYATRAELRAALRARSVSPLALVRFVECAPARPPRVDYNLACFYATRMDGDRHAQAMLRRSLERTPPSRRAGLAHRAATDPTLSSVVTARSGRALLSELELAAPGVEQPHAQPR